MCACKVHQCALGLSDDHHCVDESRKFSLLLGKQRGPSNVGPSLEALLGVGGVY